ncbi:MAG: class I SAM-dependent methyltransferase [Anaerolineales bacterium]|nr:class I SAM-dependent methyltransferase [Anaerolineales bacterium]
MKEYGESNVLNTEALGYLLGKYKERNLISRFLVSNFYRAIQNVVQLLEPTDRILEVGCGAGISSLRIRQMLCGQHFEVSDVDDNAVRQFEKIGFPIPFKQESVLQLQRADDEFDCVFLLEVLEHVPDYERALSELFRVSRKYVVVSTPNEPLWRILNLLRWKYIRDWGNTPGHVNHWSQSALVRLINRFGEILKVYGPLPWTIVIAKAPPNK